MSARTYCTAPDGTVVIDNLDVADTAWKRMRGLIGRARLEDGEGLLLPRARQVHTFGMRFPIDVAFCDANGRVLASFTMAPRRVSRWVRGARFALEAEPGRLVHLTGQVVTIEGR